MDNFEVIATFITLCRSGYYNTWEDVMERMVVLFPEHDRNDLEKVIRPAVKNMLKNFYP